MKKFKRLIALVTVAMFIFSFAAPALAADAAADAFARLKDLGVVAGGTGGDPMYDKAYTRAEAAAVMVKLQGKTQANIDAAKGGTAFTDVDGSHWASGVINLAVASGIIKGYPDGTYKPNREVSYAELAALLVQTLKYGSDLQGTYPNNVILKASSLGLFDGVAVSDFSAPVIRSNMFVAVNNLADTAPKGSTTTVAETLAPVTIASIDAITAEVNEGGTYALPAKVAAKMSNGTSKDVDVTWDKAVDTTVVGAAEFKGTVAGFATGANLTLTVKAVTLAVDSVTATNNMQVVVAFNKALDKTSAETVGNYTLSAGGPATSAKMSGNSVTLTLTAARAQQESITVKVADVKDAAGNKITTVTNTVKFFDATAPTAVSAEVTGPTTVKVTFSEPITSTAIATTANFAIDNNTYSIASVVASGTNAVVVTLGTTLPAGEHTISVNNVGTNADPAIKDYVGFFVAKTAVAFTYAVDNAAPTVSLVSAKQNEVKIKFSKAIDTTTQANLSVYHTYNNNGTFDADTTTWAADNQTVTLAFNNAYLPVGSATIFVNAGTSPTVLKDAWGNAFASATLTAAVEADTTAPTVTEVKVVNATTIEVTFSEVVSGATTAANFTLKDSANAAVAVNSSVLKAGTTATYTLTTAQMNGGSYTLSIAGIKDTSVSTNAMAAYSSAISVTDLIRPTVTATGVYSTDMKKVIVAFSEAMDASILSLANYQISFDLGVTYADLTTIAGTTIAAGTGNKSAIITFTSAQTLAPGDKVKVGRVADAAGNTTAVFTTDVTLAVDDVTIANISKVKATAKNVVTFEVNTNLSAIDVSKFNIETTADKAATAATYVNGDNKATVTVTIATGDAFATNLSNLANVEFTAGGMTTALGTSNSGTVTQAVTAATADYVAPAVVSTVTGDGDLDGKIDTIVVTYTEALYAASVQDADYTVEGYEITGVTVVGAAVTITVKELTSVDSGAKPKVTLAGAISDNTAQRNSLGAQAAVTSADGVKPVLVASSADSTDKIVTLTFGEALAAATVVAGNFTGTANDVGGVGLNVPTVAYTAGSNVVTLTYGAALSAGETIIIGAGVTDVATNTLTAVTLTQGVDY